MYTKLRKYTNLNHCPTEHQEQVALLQWWNLQAPLQWRKRLTAFPNAGKRSVIMGKYMKQEGLQPGMPDLFLAIPTKEHHGLFIEMKRKTGGRLSENQKAMIDNLQPDYKAIVCYGFEDARVAICQYLGWCIYDETHPPP